MLWKNWLINRLGSLVIVAGPRQARFFHVLGVREIWMGKELLLYGGADLAATARIRNGWMKFRELLPFLTSSAPPLEMKG